MPNAQFHWKELSTSFVESSFGVLQVVLVTFGLAAVNAFFYVSRIPAEFQMLLDATFFINYTTLFSITASAAFFIARFFLFVVLKPTFRAFRLTFLGRPHTKLRGIARAADKRLNRHELVFSVVLGGVFFVSFKFSAQNILIFYTILALAILFWANVDLLSARFKPLLSGKGRIEFKLLLFIWPLALKRLSSSPKQGLVILMVLLSTFSAILGVLGGRENLRNTVYVRSSGIEVIGALVAATGSGVIVLEGFNYKNESTSSENPKEFKYAFFPYGSFVMRSPAKIVHYNPQTR